MSVEDTQPLITHLIELRKRLLNCIIAVIVIFLCLVYFANDIYHPVSAPLIKQLPQGSTMIATDVASPFFTPIKLTFMVSLILSAPVILYQVWAFIAPALYKHERRPARCRCWFPALCCFISAWRSPTLWSFRWHLASLPIPRRKGYRYPPTSPAI